MKTKDIVNQYGFNRDDFEEYIKQLNIKCKSGFGGMIIDDGEDINRIINSYKQHENNLASSKTQKASAIANMLVTSGFSFDGYTITKYSGYISGDDAVQIDRGTSGFFSRATNVGDSLMASLVQIRRKALEELKEAAYALGCNAVIGVDFDYLTLDPQTASTTGSTVYLPYVFGVTANGNAVIIEKN